jgi:antitoxin (DNA-binding transcriptional repressor) of toxin-antitoxin stability system
MHMTESEVAENFSSVIEKVGRGAEIIIERETQPIAVLSPPQFRGRSIDECIAFRKARGSHTIPDDHYGRDVDDIRQRSVERKRAEG